MPNSNNGQVVLGLDIPKTVNQINADIKKLEKQLEQVKATGALDTDKTVKQLNAQIKSLQAQLKTIEIKATVDTKSIQKTGQQIGNQIKNATKGSSVASEILNASDLDKQGKTYILKVSNTIEATKKEIQSKLRNSGYFDIEIKGVEKANGQIKSVTVNATNAKGVLEQLNFERAKMQKGGKVTNALVQTDDVKVLGTLSSSIDKVQGNLSTLKTKWEEQGVLVGDFKTKVEQLENSLASVGSKGELNGLESQIKTLKAEASQIAEVNKIQLSMSGEGSWKSYSFEVTELIQKYKNLGLTQEQAKAKVKELSDAHNNLNTILNQNVSVYSSLEARNKAIIEADEKRTLALNKANNEYREMALTAPKILTDIQRLNKVESMQKWADNNSKAVKRYGDDIKRIIEKFAQLDVQMNSVEGDKLVAEFKQIQEAARKTGNIGMTAIDKFKGAWEKFGGWSLATGALTSVLSGMKRVGTEAINLDNNITDLTMATGLHKDQLDSLLDSYSDLGDRLNATITDVIASGTEWLKQGKSIAETEQLISSAMILDKVGKIGSSEKSTQYLTSAMKGYKVEAENTLEIVDKLSAVDMASATDVGGLAEGMSEVAASANLAGVSMDRLLGYLAAVGEVTQEGMSSVGTAYNAIFARMGNIKLSRLKDYETGEDLSNVETVLRGVGISLRDTDDSFRDFDEVLDETAKRWSTFSEVQQRAIANAFAGTHHVDSFITLMLNYDKALQYTEKSMNSSGEAMQKFEAYQESVTAHTELFNKAIQDLADTAVDSGLVNWFIDLGTTVIKTIDGLMNALGGMDGVLGASGGIALNKMLG